MRKKNTLNLRLETEENQKSFDRRSTSDIQAIDIAQHSYNRPNTTKGLFLRNNILRNQQSHLYHHYPT